MLSSQNILVECSQHILLRRPSNSLQRLMSLALSIVIFHILQRSKGRLDRDIEALIPRIGDRLASSRSDDIGFTVLPKYKLALIYSVFHRRK